MEGRRDGSGDSESLTELSLVSREGERELEGVREASIVIMRNLFSR